MRFLGSALKLLVLAIWSLGTAIIGILFVLITWRHKSAIFVAQKIWAPVILFTFGVSLKIRGAENINKKKPYVIMCNHSSFIDIPILFRSLPIEQYYIAKKELKKVPFLGWYITAAGMIFIDRSNRSKSTESLNKAADLIRKGRNVVIFPEGTATRTGEIGEFKKGGFHLALNSGADILPILIKGSRMIWPRGKMFQLRNGEAEVIIGESIPASTFGNRPVEQVAIEIRKVISRLD